MYFWVLVMNPILKGVVSSVVKATVYPYLYFYKMPMWLWISRAIASEQEGRARCLGLPGSRIMPEEPAVGEGLPAELGRAEEPFLVSAVPILYATPHPLLFWSWEIKGRLNYSNLNEVSPSQKCCWPCVQKWGALEDTGGWRRFVLAGHAWPLLAFMKPREKNMSLMLRSRQTLKQAQITPKGGLYFFYMQMPF